MVRSCQTPTTGITVSLLPKDTTQNKKEIRKDVISLEIKKGILTGVQSRFLCVWDMSYRTFKL